MAPNEILKLSTIYIPAILANKVSIFRLPFFRKNKEPAVAADNDTLAKTKEKLNELQQRYQILTENLAASVLIRDPQERLAYASPYTLVLTGYSPNEMYSGTRDFFSTIVHPDDQDLYLKAIRITEQGEPYQSRFRVIHKTGIEVWVEMRTAPIFGESAEVEGVLAIVLDVTAHVRYQRQIEDRTRDLHDLSYMISHDLRSPVLTIKGMIDILHQDLKANLPPQAHETFNHITQAVKRLEDLIGSVLNYFKLSAEESSRNRFDLRDLLSDVISDLKIAQDSAQAVIELPTDLPSIESDRLKCYRIFSNLISNAIKYRSADRAPIISISARVSASGRDLAVTVKDNGLGIPEEKLGSIFRPFQRAHGKQIDGFGVGLASVKKLVQVVGGTIEVTSKPQVGSEFCVLLRNCAPQPPSR